MMRRPETAPGLCYLAFSITAGCSGVAARRVGFESGALMQQGREVRLRMPIAAPPPSFTPLQAPDEIIREMAFPLVAVGADERAHASGTAVVIAPNVLLTARHVILDFAEIFGTRQTGQNSAEAAFDMLVHQVTSKGDAVWRVVQTWFSDLTDVAVLAVQPMSELAASHVWRYPPLRLRPPTIGEPVVGFGFHSSTAAAVGGALDWKFATATTVGVVTEVYPQRRDQKLNFPCFETSARIDGGMSGGPFFTYVDPNDIGKGMRLCGLGCSSLSPFADGGNVSWVASLWPAMGTIINLPRTDVPGGDSYPLLELVRNTAEGADKITVRKTPQGGVQVLVEG
jgi:hypothetical protein